MIGSLLPRRLPSLLSALAAPVSARQAHRDSRHLVIEVAGREFDPVRFVHDHSWTEANQTDCAVLALLKHLSFDKERSLLLRIAQRPWFAIAFVKPAACANGCFIKAVAWFDLRPGGMHRTNRQAWPDVEAGNRR